MTAQAWIAILVGAAAVIDDLKRRHIANWIPVAALVGGFGWQIGRYGWQGALWALAGAVTGFAVFLAFYLLGGMGGGDVKLMAGFGALLGTNRLLEAALWTAAVGGLVAVGALAWKSVLRLGRVRPARGGKGDAAPLGDSAMTEEQRLHANSIPYAPAIAVGVWLSLIQ